jgi:hypothetical protein
MNKIYTLGFFLALSAAFLRSSWADELVTFPNGPASWTVNIGPSTQPNHPPLAINHIVKIEVSQDSEKRRSLATWSSGTTVERWTITKYNLILAEEPDGNVVVVRDSGDEGSGYALPFGASSFRWLTTKYLHEKDPVSYEGKSCFHYQGKVDFASSYGGPTASPGIYEAWIDSKTLLPVALDDGTGLGLYSFQKTPTSALNLPPKFEAVYKRFEQ